jgi:hypothetical protein
VKTALACCFLLLTSGAAQQPQEPVPNGFIYGIVIGQDGQPAKGIWLVAEPLGVGTVGKFPTTKSDGNGEYRFENLQWWGRYTVYAEDEDAGYSGNINDETDPPEVEISPEHPKSEFRVHLPPKAGFLQIHLTYRTTGAAIPWMGVSVMAMEKPSSSLFDTTCNASHVILVPPDKNLLLHVTADGFREWDESVGHGKPIYLPSGTRLKLVVQLDSMR